MSDELQIAPSEEMTEPVAVAAPPKPKPKSKPRKKKAAPKRPDVSVLMPVHNGIDHYPETMLSYAIEAALASEGVTIELIIVNDASTDNTAPLLDALTDKRVQVIHLNDPVGQAEALNHAATVANGRYMFQYTTRARLTPGGLKALVDALDGNEQAGFASGQMQVEGQSERLHTPPAWKHINYKRQFVANFFMFRAEAFHEHGCRFTDYFQTEDGRWYGVVDRDFLLQMMVNLDWVGYPVRDQLIVIYHNGGENQTSAITQANRGKIDAELRKRWGV